MKKNITLFLIAFFFLGLGSLKAETYHEGDKTTLRAYLRQPSGETGQANLERLGLATTDTANWATTETWVTKVAGLTWDESTPKRLVKVLWTAKKLGSVLNLSGCDALQELRFGMNGTLAGVNIAGCTALTYLVCNECNLTSLNIAPLTNLQYYICDVNKFTQLDVSNHTKLIELSCANNQLTSLDASHCDSLQKLTCNANTGLTSLNVSGLVKLVRLACYRCQLTTLDVSSLPNLTYLSCYRNQLSELNVANNLKLTDLYCNENALTNLDVTNHAALLSVDAKINKLSSIEVFGCPALKTLYLNNNCLKFSTLPLKAPTFLTYWYAPQDTVRDLEAYCNQTIDLSSEYTIGLGSQPHITTYRWYDITSGTPTEITEGFTANEGKFVFSPTYNGKTLRCEMQNEWFTGAFANINLVLVHEINLIGVAPSAVYNETDKAALRSFLRQAAALEGKRNFEQLGLVLADTLAWHTSEDWVAKVIGVTWNSETPKQIKNIDWNEKRLSGSLDLTNLTELDFLSCDENKINGLVVQGCTKLEILKVALNLLRDLDVSSCTALKELVCAANQITNLNIAGLANLDLVYCFENDLPGLDLTGLSNLRLLYCNENVLESLTISDLPKLEILQCEYNFIPTMHISNCPLLQKAYFTQNLLTSLTFSNTPSLWYVRCENNQLTSLDLSTFSSLKFLSCFQNQLEELDLTMHPDFFELYCQLNPIRKLNVEGLTKLGYLYCYYNRLKFSTLPKQIIQYYGYAPQQTALDNAALCNSEIDLSSEYSVTRNGVTKYTNYRWHFIDENNIADPDPITSGYTENQGKFVFDASFNKKRVICFMQNDNFFVPGNPMTELNLARIVEFIGIDGVNAHAEANDIHIYPNPGKAGNIFLETKEYTGKITATIYNLSGQVVSTTILENGIQKLPTEGLEGGIYVVKVTTPTKTKTSKLVIQ